jgi:hypothetical protein
VTNETLQAYLDAWDIHCCGDTADADAMVAASHPDICYEDINNPTPMIGHEGVRNVCAFASQMLPGAKMNYRDLLTDGRNWSVQWELTGVDQASGKAFSCRGASAGTIADDGRVDHQIDYWNPAHLQSATA